MKKSLFLAAILFAAVGCNESPIDEPQVDATVTGEHQVTINVTASSQAVSRVSITPGDSFEDSWSVDWESDDELTLISTEGSVTTLSIDTINGNAATFTGDIAEGEYYVYCLDSYSVAGSEVTIDYSTQGDDCSDVPMMMEGTLTVGGDGSISESNIVLSHMAQAMDIQMQFANIGSDSYTLTAVEIVGDDYFDGSIMVSTSQAELAEGTTYSVKCYMPELTVAASESINLVAYLDLDGQEISVETAVNNTSSDPVTFVAGTHNYLQASFTLLSNLTFSSIEETNTWIATAESGQIVNNLTFSGSGTGSTTDIGITNVANVLAKISEVHGTFSLDGTGVASPQNTNDSDGVSCSPFASVKWYGDIIIKDNIQMNNGNIFSAMFKSTDYVCHGSLHIENTTFDMGYESNSLTATTAIGGNLTIIDCENFTSTAFKNVTSIGGDLYIENSGNGNGSRTFYNFNQMSKMQSIGGDITIIDNGLFSSFQGFTNITSLGASKITISGNCWNSASDISLTYIDASSPSLVWITNMIDAGYLSEEVEVSLYNKSNADGNSYTLQDIYNAN